MFQILRRPLYSAKLIIDSYQGQLDFYSAQGETILNIKAPKLELGENGNSISIKNQPSLNPIRRIAKAPY